MPKNKVNTASAATLSVTMTVTEQYDYRWGVAKGYADKTIDYTTMMAGGGNHTIDVSAKKISLYGTPDNNPEAIYVGFQVSVKVPAWTEYNMSFPFEVQAVKVNGAVGTAGRVKVELLYFGCTEPNEYTAANGDGGNPLTFNKSYMVSTTGYDGGPTVGANVTSKVVLNQNLNTSTNGNTKTPKNDTTTIEEKYTNETDNEVTVSYNYGFFANDICSTTTGNISLGLEVCPTYVQLGTCTAEVKELWVSAPTDVSVGYTGSDLGPAAAEAIEGASWYTKDGADYYTPGSWAGFDLPDEEIVNVKEGGYTATAKLNDKYPFKLTDGTFTTADQDFKIKVTPADPTLKVLVNASGTALYEGETLGNVTIELDPSGNNPAGSVAWSAPSSKLQSGANACQYKFTSEDANYNSVTQTYTLTVGAVEFEKITAEYKQSGSVYPSTDVSKGLPGTLTVKKVANNGTEMGTLAANEYTLSAKSTLTAGNTCKVVVTYVEGGKSYTAEIDVEVSAPKLQSISAQLQEGKTVYESTTLQQLAQWLTVTAYYEDYTNNKLGFTEYTLTGKLVKSTNSTVTVTVNNTENWAGENSGKCTLSVYVEPAAVESIEVKFSPVDEEGGVVTIYDRTTTSELKPYMQVTAKYEDGSTRVLTAEEYAVSGSLSGKTTALLTVEYGGKTDQVQISNIVKAQLVRVWVETFDQGNAKIYDSDTLDVLKEYLIVKAEYSHKPGTEYIVTEECTFEGELIASETEPSIISVLFEGEQTDNGEISVNVSAGDLELFEKVTSGNIKLVYNGAEQTLSLTNYKEEYMTVRGISATAAGKYKAVISLKDPVHTRWDDRTKSDIEIEWEIAQLVINYTVESPAYSGEEISFEQLISLTETQWGYVSAAGKLKATEAGTYSVTLTISAEHYGNVIWGTQTQAAEKKATKKALAEETESAEREITWTITPASLSGLWDESGSVPVLSLSSASVASVPSDLIKYVIKDAETGATVKAGELQSGKTYEITATLNTDDPRAANYAFTAQTEQMLASPYEFSIAEAPLTFWQKAINFVKANWLWFVIALAVLLFLIILIVIIAKRRKNKEAREAKKEAKEEEKRRREEEREAAKAKREAELELQKAKQEAELAKIKAQAGIGAGVAGLAMAMQQPAQAQQQMPQQQPYQAPAQPQQQMPQQPYPQMQAMPQQMMQYPYPPMPQPQYPQMQQGNELAEIKAELTRLRELRETDKEFAAMRTEQRTDRELSAMKTELEIAKLNSQNTFAPYMQMPPQTYGGGANETRPDMEMLSSLLVATWRKMSEAQNGARKELLPQTVSSTQTAESETAAVTHYPPDAVITTTTTVDTTKNVKPAPRSDDDRMFDIDGFYDTFEDNK